MPAESLLIAENLKRVREQIARAAQRSGRSPEEITVVAVSKTFSAQVIRSAYDAGLRHFGENRVQEFEAKRAEISGLLATWHLIGHLQSNKARRAVRLFDRLDSLDSIELANKLDAMAVEEGKRLSVLVEVRLADEAAKTGIGEACLPRLVDTLLGLAHLDWLGLMCIPPFSEGPEEARRYFRRLRELRDEMGGRAGCVLPVLSMGMSHDFEVAIEEGATEIRLGTALFGRRSTEA